VFDATEAPSITQSAYKSDLPRCLHLVAAAAAAAAAATAAAAAVAAAAAAAAGLQVQSEGNAAVVEALTEKGVLLKEEQYAHKYPYDWRTKKPTIFRATSQWFASVEGFR
jgi:isoleucyl-tRNA synthetase